MSLIVDCPLYHLLREGEVDKFNEEIEKGNKAHLENSNLRGVDLKKAHLKGVSLKGCYLGSADMRALDLRFSNLEGASIKNAKIGGVFFPSNITPEEIRLSLDYGTRIRVIKEQE